MFDIATFRWGSCRAALKGGRGFGEKASGGVRPSLAVEMLSVHRGGGVGPPASRQGPGPGNALKQGWMGGCHPGVGTGQSLGFPPLVFALQRDSNEARPRCHSRSPR